MHEFLYFKSQARCCVEILSNSLDAKVAALLAGPLISYFEEAASGLSRVFVLVWRVGDRFFTQDLQTHSEQFPPSRMFGSRWGVVLEMLLRPAVSGKFLRSTGILANPTQRAMLESRNGTMPFSQLLGAYAALSCIIRAYFGGSGCCGWPVLMSMRWDTEDRSLVLPGRCS